MKVIRAKVLGFCMGVRRAVEMADAAISAAASPVKPPAVPDRPPIFTLGPLIHNPQVLVSLTERGVQILDETKSPGAVMADAVVIIRAHGVGPDTERQIQKQGARIIDATCPRVKANQNAALTLAEKGYRIFLAGEKDHAEIKGIYGYTMEGASQFMKKSALFKRPPEVTSCVIVGNNEEAERCAAEAARQWKDQPVKTALIGQTTISEDEYQSIAEAIKKHFPNLEVKNTICEATRDRQGALRELCSAVDAVVIAGGKESANTRRLLSIARDCGKPAWIAESAAGLPPEIMRQPEAGWTFSAIGLSAGASTPDSVIDELEQALL